MCKSPRTPTQNSSAAFNAVACPLPTNGLATHADATAGNKNKSFILFFFSKYSLQSFLDCQDYATRNCFDKKMSMLPSLRLEQIYKQTNIQIKKAFLVSTTILSL